MTSISPRTYFIETYGCAANQADSAIMEGILHESGYEKTTFNQAKYIIINTCAVKQATENKLRALLTELYQYTLTHPDKKLIIAGCLPHIELGYIELIGEIAPSFSAIIGLNSIIKIGDIIARIEKGEEHLIIVSDTKIDKARYLSDHQTNQLTAIIPISEGCTGICTYCCVKNARGGLRCYEPDSIVRAVEHYLRQGVKQIYLTSQDCSTYTDQSTTLADLIARINDLPYKFYIRIGMLNPSVLMHNYDQITDILRLKKVYQFLHLPIQSGSNQILMKMKRPYKISDVMGRFENLREQFPFLTISTDVICGFPGETEHDFYKTLNFIKWLQPEILNISQFTPRPGTKAKEMTQLKSEIIKTRTTRLTSVFRTSLEYMNRAWMGWEGEVLVLHKGNEPHQTFGRNFAYKNVFFKDYQGEFGTFVNVKITNVQGFNLYAKILKQD
ncbi:MAG: tRNA (N(6)-L-threonylcarbamoyladenosine(37)-C(2))-methylthiotransferase [Promethearchaeota archaeon]|nr:MAG: tRNA (N(6)-L-threonylcarbamoyladenosine(37)-C(2))-methylthiotransferase [Candidatus Lokiarchaeota archaeon]